MLFFKCVQQILLVNGCRPHFMGNFLLYYLLLTVQQPGEQSEHWPFSWDARRNLKAWTNRSVWLPLDLSEVRELEPMYSQWLLFPNLQYTVRGLMGFCCHGIDSAAFGTIAHTSLMYFLNPVGNLTKQQTHLSSAKAKPPNAAWITPWMVGNTLGSLLEVWSLTACQSVT